MLLCKVYNLFVKMPPVSFSELFGEEPEQQQDGGALQRQNTEWKDEDKEEIDNFDPFKALQEAVENDRSEGLDMNMRKTMWK